MKIIGIETSSREGSVALGAGDAVAAHRALGGGAAHGRLLVPMLGRLLSEAGWSRQQIGAVAVSVGPGSFTGVRIGLSVAKTFAYVHRVPVYAVSSLEVIAHGAQPFDGLVCAVTDAFGGAVYCGGWRGAQSGLQAFAAPPAQAAHRIAQARGKDENVLLVGGGADKVAAVCAESWRAVADPELVGGGAQSVVLLGLRAARTGGGEAWGAVAAQVLREPEYKPTFGAGGP